MLYADVILPVPLKGMFTYAVPQIFEKDIVAGMRVIVPFGARKFYTGIVAELHERELADERIKPISFLPDAYPAVTNEQLNFWNILSSYYCCSSGDIYKAALPSGLRLESESIVVKNPEFEPEAKLSKSEISVLDVIDDGKPHSIGDIIANTEIKNPVPAINRLVAKNAVCMQENMRDGYKPKFTEYISLSDTIHTEEEASLAMESLKRAQKQKLVFEEFIKGMLENGGFDISYKVRKSEFTKRIGGASAAINSLVDKGLLKQVYVKTDRIDYDNICTSAAHALTDVQQAAYEGIVSQFEDGKGTVLLHGVTGSGKTEIFIRLIQDVLAQGRQVLMLVPEISLSTQLASRLKKVFGGEMGVYHPRYSDHERFELWNDMLLKRRFGLILGVKTSVFLPFHDLGLIIVDEEHDSNYKQANAAPRYNAKHAALMLANMCGCRTLLASATPSVESYSNCLTKKYGYVALQERYKNVMMPDIQLVDMNEVYKKRMLKGHFSFPMTDAIRETIANGEQVILFQNKRGYSSFVQCVQCAHVPKCPNCDVSLTYHRTMNKLTCHYCNFTVPFSNICPECGSGEMDTRGFGTEQIEFEVKELFPDARVMRMDSDTTRKKNSFDELFCKFQNREIDILIGTQMVSKGLDFDNIGLVGVMNADNLLYHPDFRAHERAFQLLVQVSGRAGRSEKRGRVLIQTTMATHPIMRQITNNDYWAFFSQQMSEREMFKYPPYFKLIRLIVKHKDSAVLNKGVELLAGSLRKSFGDRVLGPDVPTVGRIQNLYLKHLIIKIENKASSERAKGIIDDIVRQIQVAAAYKSLIISIDIDPM